MLWCQGTHIYLYENIFKSDFTKTRIFTQNPAVILTEVVSNHKYCLLKEFYGVVLIKIKWNLIVENCIVFSANCVLYVCLFKRTASGKSYCHVLE
jgi:hypothetical protein